MKHMRRLMLVSLLMIGSITFADSSLEKLLKHDNSDFAKILLKLLHDRKDLKINGTSLEKAQVVLNDTLFQAGNIALSVGLCSYSLDFMLARFQATKDINNRENLATGTCAALYSALYASFKHEEVNKLHENKETSGNLSKESKLNDSKKSTSSWFTTADK